MNKDWICLENILIKKEKIVAVSSVMISPSKYKSYAFFVYFDQIERMFEYDTEEQAKQQRELMLKQLMEE